MNYVAGFLRLVSYVCIFIFGVAIGMSPKYDNSFIPFIFMIGGTISGSSASVFSSYYWQHKGIKKEN